MGRVNFRKGEGHFIFVIIRSSGTIRYNSRTNSGKFKLTSNFRQR